MPSKFTRVAAARVAWRAWRRLGVPRGLARAIAFACRKQRLPYAIAYAVCQQESNFRNVFGHDAGGLFPGERVTLEKYRRLQVHLRQTRGPGANGVGPFQITYYTYIIDSPGLWKVKANAYKGVEIIDGHIDRHGTRKGLAVYNGGEGNPQYDYADEVLRRIDNIRPKLTKEGR